jgi:hypothetical protein
MISTRPALPIPIPKLRKAMHSIAAKKGDFKFFGLFLREDSIGEWDLVVSAPWLESHNLKDLRQFVKLLSKDVGKQSLRRLRLVVLDPRDQELKAVVSEYSVDDGEIRVQRSTLFGLDVEDAIILRSWKAA